MSRASTDEEQIKICLNLSTIAWQNAYNEEALQYAKKALEIAKKINNEKFQADAHRLLGIAYFNRLEYEKALLHYQLAQGIYASLPLIDTLNLARTLNNIGLLYSYQGYIYISQQYFHRALYLRKLIRDSIGISNSLTNIGRLKSSSRQYDSARYYFWQAYALRKGDTYLVISSMMDIAESFRKEGQMDSALVYYQRAYELGLANNTKYNASFALSSMSNIYYRLGAYAKALQYAIMSDTLSKDGSYWQRVRSLNAVAQAYVGMRKFSLAKKVLQQALEIGIRTQSRTELVNTYQIQYKLDSLTGNYRKALYWLNQYHALKDSIASATYLNQALEMQYIKEISHKQEVVLQLQNERKLKAVQEKNYRFITRAIGVIIVLLLAAIAFFAYTWQRIKTQSKELAQRQKIIENTNEALTKINEAYQQKATELTQTVCLLNQTNQALFAANCEKDNLMEIIAQDLKLSVEKISSLAQIVKSSNGLSEQQLELVQLINLSAQKSINLISNILLLNALESGHNPIKAELTNLHYLLTVHVQPYVHQSQEKQILFEWHNEVVNEILIDPKFLLRIIDNLLSNAIKFTRAGGRVVLHTTVEQAQLVIRVIDEGQGISIDEQKLLFTKFKRLSAIPIGAEFGAGMGLAIVKYIVEKMQGKIEVESVKGKGSTFTVYLPLQTLRYGAYSCI
ncbi:MAG: ATP-binding protein [Cytophagales bacterium]|nr:ATP-binding protein [Bernardetiaceae bacterium]MDW8209524.1 ATP-binding protein [Cytophagales bacterium]